MLRTNYEAVVDIRDYLRISDIGFEYGLGSSARYWISMGCKVISVEHDKDFF